MPEGWSRILGPRRELVSLSSSNSGAKSLGLGGFFRKAGSSSIYFSFSKTIEVLS
jgi:hypothetical protein